jgi:hypothetical protein
MQEGFYILTERERYQNPHMTKKWEESRIAITREEIEKLERVTRP